MLPFITKLIECISSVTNEAISKSEPKDDLQEGEVELAILNEDERRAYTAIQEIGSRVEKLISAHMLKHLFNANKLANGECKKSWEDSLRMIKEIKLINTIIWNSIDLRIPNCPDALAIRKGWKVVKASEEDGSGKLTGGVIISMATKFPPYMCN